MSDPHHTPPENWPYQVCPNCNKGSNVQIPHLSGSNASKNTSQNGQVFQQHTQSADAQKNSSATTTIRTHDNSTPKMNSQAAQSLNFQQNTITTPNQQPNLIDFDPMDEQTTSENYSHGNMEHFNKKNYEPQVPIVAIGNPGAGKSTILNALAGQILFKSGISLGSGLTNQLDSKEAKGRIFIDTPGMADDTYRQAAGEALTKIFHDGGRMKILFFITQEAGRIVLQDVATMKLVLESVPQIGRNYGIIVNKIPKKVLSQLNYGENLERLVLSMYSGIKDEFTHDNFLLLPRDDKMDNMDNVFLNPSDIHPELEDFIYSKIPEAYITPGKITEIPVDRFEQVSKQVEDLKSELKKNQERQTMEKERLRVQLEEVEKEKNNQEEETKKKNEKFLERMKEEIKKTEKEMENLKQRSENESLKLEQMKQKMNEQLEQAKEPKKKPLLQSLGWKG